jgi:mannose-6-phosphate isomerase-like protein (cupin superfamily)
MKIRRLRFGKGFRVLPGNRRSQAAEMVIPPGDAEGDPRNRHRGADQWLFVVEGTASALVNGRRHRLSAGSLIFIPKGERHEIKNTGRGLLRTLTSTSRRPTPRAATRCRAVGGSIRACQPTF